MNQSKCHRVAAGDLSRSRLGVAVAELPPARSKGRWVGGRVFLVLRQALYQPCVRSDGDQRDLAALPSVGGRGAGMLERLSELRC